MSACMNVFLLAVQFSPTMQLSPVTIRAQCEKTPWRRHLAALAQRRHRKQICLGRCCSKEIRLRLSDFRCVFSASGQWAAFPQPVVCILQTDEKR